MTLQASGSMTSAQINTEIGRNANDPLSMDDPVLYNMTALDYSDPLVVPNDLYGKTAQPLSATYQANMTIGRWVNVGAGINGSDIVQTGYFLNRDGGGGSVGSLSGSRILNYINGFTHEIYGLGHTQGPITRMELQVAYYNDGGTLVLPLGESVRVTLTDTSDSGNTITEIGRHKDAVIGVGYALPDSFRQFLVARYNDGKTYQLTVENAI